MIILRGLCKMNFKIGDKVKSSINIYFTYEVIIIEKNHLHLRVLNEGYKGIVHRVNKSVCEKC